MRPAVLILEHRPITAGGFTRTGPVIFGITVQGRSTLEAHHMGLADKNSSS